MKSFIKKGINAIRKLVQVHTKQVQADHAKIYPSLFVSIHSVHSVKRYLFSKFQFFFFLNITILLPSSLLGPKPWKGKSCIVSLRFFLSFFYSTFRALLVHLTCSKTEPPTDNRKCVTFKIALKSTFYLHSLCFKLSE